MRAGAEMDSPKTGVLSVGTMVEAMERRMLDDGTTGCISGADGFLSLHAPASRLKLARGKVDRGRLPDTTLCLRHHRRWPLALGPVPNKRANKAKPTGKPSMESTMLAASTRANNLECAPVPLCDTSSPQGARRHAR